MNSTISKTITPGITLVSSSYGSYLHVTNIGALLGQNESLAEVYSAGADGRIGGTALMGSDDCTILNEGVIVGGGGGPGAAGTLSIGTVSRMNYTIPGKGGLGGAGGVAIYIGDNSNLSNKNLVLGGSGGRGGSYGGDGGCGAAGVTMVDQSVLTNNGSIIGGGGGQGGSLGAGGAAGTAIVIGDFDDVENFGIIIGGSNGPGGDAGASGLSAGLSDYILNTDLIAGSAGGSGVSGAPSDVVGGYFYPGFVGGVGAAGGAGLALGSTDILSNTGTIVGGSGGAGGYYKGTGGLGGSAVVISTFNTLTNSGIIFGGQGGEGGRAGGDGGIGGTGIILRGYNTLINEGTILGGDGGTGGQSGYHQVRPGYIAAGIGGIGGNGAYITNGDILVNYAEIIGGTGGFRGENPNRNQGSLAGGGIGVDANGGILVNSGRISAGDSNTIGDAVLFSGASGTLVVEAGGNFSGDVVDAFGDGLLILSQGSPSTLCMGNSFSGFSEIDFSNQSPWILEGGTLDLTGGEVINGFTVGDSIQLNGFSAGTDTYVAGKGLILAQGNLTETLDVVGSFTTADFYVVHGESGTSITDPAPCFLAGTRLATARGKIPVESLKIGDMLKTTRGNRRVKWIGTSSYSGRFIEGNHLVLPIRIRRHALGLNVPSRDLYVSPDHAICVRGVLVYARLLINGASITQVEKIAQVDYFHVELNSHAIILAENLSVESYLDTGCRSRFQNAHTAPKTTLGRACLPRVEDGYYLAGIKSFIDARAGLRPTMLMGRLQGSIDEASVRLRGWAQDAAAPETPVELEVIGNGIVIDRIIANRYREDLRAARLGSGCHAFDVPMPQLFGKIILRRVTDGAVLGERLVQAA